MKRQKLIVFGIDGGTLQLIERWKDGLPNFKRVMESGQYGHLESTVPPYTCPAWPCMFTGKNPAELGMFYFMDYDTGKVFNSDDWWEHSVFDILRNRGYEVGLLNVPMTYPVQLMDYGFMVTGMGTPDGGRFTWPPDLVNELPDYIINPPTVLTQKGKEEEYFNLFMRAMGQRYATMKKLMNGHPWDLFTVVFFNVDSLQHYLWNDDEKLLACYLLLDDALGYCLGQDCNVLVASDHGFSEFKRTFNVNTWLEQNGYLAYKQKPKRNAIYSFRDWLLPQLPTRALKVARRLLSENMRTKLSGLGEERVNMLSLKESVDWGKTKAYCAGMSGAIFLQDADAWLPIMSGLNGVAGIEVLHKQQVYHGDFYGKAPDLTVVGDGVCPVGNPSDELWGEPWCQGMHHPQGLFMACGQDIENRGKVDAMRISDVAPHILKLFGVKQ